MSEVKRMGRKNGYAIISNPGPVRAKFLRLNTKSRLMFKHQTAFKFTLAKNVELPGTGLRRKVVRFAKPYLSPIKSNISSTARPVTSAISPGV
jgi:hypothetical protein